MQNIRPLRFPYDWLRFLYWIFFKPITLHRYINEIDPTLPDYPFGVPAVVLWNRRNKSLEFQQLISLMLSIILIAPLLLSLILQIIFQLIGLEMSLFLIIMMVLGAAYGVVVGLILIWMADIGKGIAFEIVGCIAFSVVGYVAWNIELGSGFLAVLIKTTPIVLMAASVSLGVALGSESDWRLALAMVVTIFIIGILGSNRAAGLTAGMMFLFCYFRVFIYAFEFPWSIIVARFHEWDNGTSPVQWDEVIWFPLPGLDGLLLKSAKQNRQKGMEAIAFVATSFRQGWAAKRALLELTAYDINNARNLNSIAEISNNLSWLPDDARMNMQDLLLGLEQASQHARAALESETLYNKQEQLRMGLSVVERMRGGLALAQNSDVARQMIPALEGWKTVFTQELSDASGKEQIPNVYHSGTPLIKESKTFKGRRDLFRSLSNELINPSGQRPALLLFGARRMGKSSTLKQLPVQLGPQIIPATVDLQSLGAVESASSLLYLIAREIIRSARQERRLTLSELTREQLEQDPYSAFQEWLEKVNKALGDYYWILLALDEFEALGEMLSAGRIDERVFQTLRGIIQHHPRITILVSGAHTLEELPPLWSNYLINTKMLKVGPLEETDARELITHPIENFPLTYDEDAVSLLLHDTGCHPNWLQFTCRELVENLNNESRFHASRTDVELTLNKVPQVLAGDFKDLWEGRDSNDLIRSVLKFVASAKEDSVDESKLLKQFAKQKSELQNSLSYLSRRDILVNENGQYCFKAALLRRWVAKQP